MPRTAGKRSTPAAASLLERHRSLALTAAVLGGLLLLGGIAYVARPSGIRTGAGSAVPIATLHTQDVHSLQFAGSPQHILFGHHFGILESLDGGRTWRALAARADAMSLEDAVDSIVIAGHQVFQESHDGGATWAPIESDLPSLDIHAFARSLVDPKTMWAYLAVGGIYRSIDAGHHWTIVFPGDTVDLVATASGGRDVLWSVDPFQGITRSDDGGRSWVPVGRPPAAPVASMAATPDGRTIVLGTGRGLYRSDDGATSWRALLPDVTFLATAVSPDGRTIMAVSDKTDVYRSDDAGATWADK